MEVGGVILLNVSDSPFSNDWGVESVYFGSWVVGKVDVRVVRYYT